MTNSYITFLQNQGNTPHAWANLPGFMDALTNRNPDTLSVVNVPGGTASADFDDEWAPYAVPDVAFCFEGTNLWYTLNGATSWAKVTAPVGSGGYADEVLVGDAFTSTAGNYRIFAQTGTTDDLATINGGVTGDVVKLKPNPADTITVKHGTGNITLLSEIDFVLATPEILLLEYDGSDWIEIRTSEVRYGVPFVHIQDQKSAGVDGGSSVVTTWNIRTLNTEVTDTHDLASLSSNQITLSAGTYLMEATAPAHGNQASKLKLYNTTGATTLLVGTPADMVSLIATVISTLSGRFTVAAGQALELQHYTDASETTTGLGKAAGGSEIEVYADVRIWKVSD